MRAWWALLAIVAGCQGNEAPHESVSTAAPTGSTAPENAPAGPPPRTRAGSAIALTETGDAVLIAEEDRKALWRVATPVTKESQPRRVDLEGRPAQVLPLRDRILVTIRDPGLLLVLDGELAEIGRVSLPADAWGLAVTADARTAVVTSAWTHRVTAIDLESLKTRWSVEVAREPRAVVIPKEGDRAYVTHLVGKELTRIDGLAAPSPRLTRVALPAAPSRTHAPEEVGASLAYSAVLSPAEDLLFVPRHANGALGSRQDEPSWFGATSVDVLVTADDTPLAPEREGPYRATKISDFVKNLPEHQEPFLYGPMRDIDGPHGALPLDEAVPFVQPRAVAYRSATHTLLVASEGTDEIVELDAAFIEPALVRRKRYRVGGDYGNAIGYARHGGAPSGIALSPDESLAYVFCRSTSDLAVVKLVPIDNQTSPEDTLVLRLGDDPLLDGVAAGDPKRKFLEAAAVGRKLFFNAIDTDVSGGMGCAGCHPEGRDDGHVWHEIDITLHHAEKTSIFLGGPALVRHHAAAVETAIFTGRTEIHGEARARQTPMLAGRVQSKGRFGWRGESDGLVARIHAGFGLHRWSLANRWWSVPSSGPPSAGPAGALASFLLSGLVEPPRLPAELTEEQARGKAIFESDAAACSSCHLPDESFSNWMAVKIGAPGRRPGFADERDAAFKTPSLRHVGGTPPYFHDGSVATLAELVARNGDRMGNTSHLSPADQKALVAYLESL